MQPPNDVPPPPGSTIRPPSSDTPNNEHGKKAGNVFLFIVIGVLALLILLAGVANTRFDPLRKCIQMRKEKKAQKESEEEARRMRLRMADAETGYGV